jgi:hypothetical protein
MRQGDYDEPCLDCAEGDAGRQLLTAIQFIHCGLKFITGLLSSGCWH